MFIKVTCPNGHKLKVAKQHAGRQGTCPTCKAKVLIPKPEPSQIDEDEILSVLGPGPLGVEKKASFAASVEDLPVHQDPKHHDFEMSTSDSSLAAGSSGSSSMRLAARRCPSCKKSVSPSYSICPYCRTYLLEMSDVKESVSVRCPVCDTPSFPGAEICSQCGTQLLIRGQP